MAKPPKIRARLPLARRAPRPRTPPASATAVVRLLLTTVPPKAAAAISRALVEARVAACVNAIGGVASTYRWKVRVERARETLLLVKTSRASERACRRLLEEVHPYDVPEIVVVKPSDVAPRYAAWVLAEIR